MKGETDYCNMHAGFYQHQYIYSMLRKLLFIILCALVFFPLVKEKLAIPAFDAKTTATLCEVMMASSQNFSIAF